MALHAIPTCMDDEFLSYVEETFLNEPEKPAAVCNGEISDVRRSVVKMKRDESIENHLWNYVSDLNAEHYGYDIWKHCHLQYTVYQGDDNGYYGWHVDTNYDPAKKSARKLSVTIQLSHSDEYEGGDFEVQDINISSDLRRRGSLLMFPSWLPHQVTPVTSGTRKSLVAWFNGPMWR